MLKFQKNTAAKIMRADTKWMRFSKLADIALFAASVALSTTTHAQLPAEMVVSKNSFSSKNYTASTNGDVFAIRRDGENTALVSMPSGTMALTAIAPDELPVDAQKQDWQLIITADGKYALNIARGRIAVQSLPDASIIWSGLLGESLRPYLGLSFFYKAGSRQLLVAAGNRLNTYALEDGQPAKLVESTRISFSDSPNADFREYVPGAVFSVDGRTLFAGTMDGDVLAVDTSEKTPRLKWRLNVFQDFKAPGFSDNGERSVSRVKCADDCQKLIVQSFRDFQLAVVDTKASKILGKTSAERRMNLVGVGDGLFAMTRSDRAGKDFALVNAMLEPITPMTLTKDLLLFGRKGGYVSGIFGDPQGAKVVFRDATPAIAEARKRQEALKEEERRLAQQERDNLEAERKRMQLIAQELSQFRSKLKSGDDSNCGLVVERKGEIAQVETMIGLKWVKVKQLYIPGIKGCHFVNGILQ